MSLQPLPRPAHRKCPGCETAPAGSRFRFGSRLHNSSARAAPSVSSRVTERSAMKSRSGRQSTAASSHGGRMREQREERIELIAGPARRQKEGGGAASRLAARQTLQLGAEDQRRQSAGGGARRPRVQQHPQRVCAGTGEIGMPGVAGAADDQRYDWEQETVR